MNRGLLWKLGLSLPAYFAPAFIGRWGRLLRRSPGGGELSV
jgi:hypothetical protein